MRIINISEILHSDKPSLNYNPNNEVCILKERRLFYSTYYSGQLVNNEMSFGYTLYLKKNSKGEVCQSTKKSIVENFIQEIINA